MKEEIIKTKYKRSYIEVKIIAFIQLFMTLVAYGICKDDLHPDALLILFTLPTLIYGTIFLTLKYDSKNTIRIKMTGEVIEKEELEKGLD